MRVAMVSAEMVPFAKVGGLGDVVGALSKELQAGGHDVVVFLPHYRDIHPSRHPGLTFEPAGEVEIGMGSTSARATITLATIRETGVRLGLIGNEGYYHRPDPYVDPATGQDWPDNDERFILFSRAVLESFPRLGWFPEVIHCNDYQSGIIPILLRERHQGHPGYDRVATVFSIHNVGYQGIFPQETLWKIEVGPVLARPTGPLEYYGKVNFMKAAILYADVITTVSERYAQEIQSGNEYGFGLEGVLRSRSEDLLGIRNGIDQDLWNPATDPLLPFNFTSKDLAGKKQNKVRLLESMNLPVEPDVPLVGIISRLVDQKGFDLFEAIAPQLFSERLKIAILGSGMPRYEELLRGLREKHPNKLSVALEFNEPLAHLIEAGSDFFLMPSRYEPCGLNQMYSQRYGTVPIVRATGGLADTVQDYDPQTGRGSGFVFEEYAPEPLLATIRRALAAYEKKRPFKKLVTDIMKIDHSWASAAAKYVEVYRKVAARRSRA